ncbi:MAG TPA: hypothetical protein VG387_16970 [Rhizomicrobium sp.]|jgi:carbamoylphosphate synthase large subunit|nr:hypothetical protein [Rhizomicrobium sp.]
MAFRVIVTDAGYKHSIAFADYAKRALTDIEIVGHTPGPATPARWHRCYDRVVAKTPLETLLAAGDYDMVAPIGGNSVLTVAAAAPDKAVLAPREKIEMCFDKTKTIAFARAHGVPVPDTRTFELGDTIDLSGMAFPCVVKASRENASVKAVTYCYDAAALQETVTHQLAAMGGQSGLLVQEFIKGTGAGLFALYDRGTPQRVFMHERIREAPPSGGISTAARAYDSDRLKELGLRLLTALGWHGPAMVEFRRSAATGEFVLMEINGKFWGSLELSLASGVNFAADIIRIYRGEALGPDPGYDRNTEFYWPLDGDILTLWKTGALGRMADYRRPNAHTNLGRSVRSDMRKAAALLGKMIRP